MLVIQASAGSCRCGRHTLSVESVTGRQQTRDGHGSCCTIRNLLQLPAIADNLCRGWTPELDAAFPLSTLVALRAVP